LENRHLPILQKYILLRDLPAFAEAATRRQVCLERVLLEGEWAVNVIFFMNLYYKGVHCDLGGNGKEAEVD
jgi:hypothetical protein